VRVPLVVVGAGVRRGARVATVVQTIDALPTALSALGIPRPAGLRGRDLGPLLTGAPKPGDAKPGDAKPGDAGFALSETDDYTLVASGSDRLICQRRAAACALYRPGKDPLERADVAGEAPSRAAELRGLLRSAQRDHGRYEASAGPALPEVLRRGMQGDADAALDVASLLDDANVDIRRRAAEVCFSLHVAATLPQVKRALAVDEDAEVRRWSALALVRLGEPVPALVETLLHDAQASWRRAAALALAERGNPHACDELADWWTEVTPVGERSDGEPPQLSIDLARAQELLSAVAKAHCRAAVPPLVLALADVRARPYVADTLGAVGDDRARGPLLALLPQEVNVMSRQREVAALHELGVSADVIDRLQSHK
jgi:hypothetical protein